jgi:pimeloyl-ACP methyl ester carboxylesterase
MKRTAPLHVERGGRGEATVLLLHGLGATAAVWHGVAERLDAAGLAWIAPDLPGHGASARPDTYSVGQLATDVAPLVIDTPRVIAAGHSLGAYVALALASGWFGVRVAAVLGIGPKIAWSAQDLAATGELAARPVRVFATEEEAVARYRKVAGLDERIAPPALLARGIARSGDGFALAADPRTMLVAGAPFRTLAHAACCPVVLARGEHDPMVTLAELRAHAAEAVELTGRGHNAHAEDPDAVAALCARLARAGAV